MIFGAHVILYSRNAEADRDFLRDVLGFRAVDADHGWLIFALPPAEAAVHPADENGRHELYLMCDDLQAEIASLGKKGVRCSEVHNERWGSVTKIPLPGGGTLGLYEPKHPLAMGGAGSGSGPGKTMAQITSAITPENRYNEISTGPEVGRERVEW